MLFVCINVVWKCLLTARRGVGAPLSTGLSVTVESMGLSVTVDPVGCTLSQWLLSAHNLWAAHAGGVKVFLVAAV